MYTLSTLSIFLNEGMNFKEWIDHYLWQGVEHFYLIDNGSTDNYKEIIEPYMKYITLYDRPERNSQAKHYNEIFLKIKNDTKWLFVCDLDEFLFNVDADKTLLDYLADKDEYCAISTHMRMFGSRDEYEHPESIRLAFFDRDKELHDNGKSIVKCSKVVNLDIHFHSYVENCNILTDNDNIHLNHYFLQSKEYFDKIKKTRGDAVQKASDNVRNDEYFKRRDYRDVKDYFLRDLLQNRSNFISEDSDSTEIVRPSGFKLLYLLIPIILFVIYKWLC
jgi:hypothetical protein